jgi:DNA adenine methylase
MILKRLGNKKKIAKEIIKFFPAHSIYIEPFFGAGGMFFNKPKVKYNIVNDIDSDVFNLFQVVSNCKEELEKEFFKTPIHQDLLKFWKDNKEDDPIKKALRFLMLSNFVLNGRGTTLRVGASGGSKGIKNNFYKQLDATFELINDVQFCNQDFKVFFKSFSLDDRNNNKESDNTLIYCDPPYLCTGDNYSDSFTEEDSNDLFDCLEESKCKFAMSEFDHPFILEQAEKRGLNIIYIGERQNLKNRRTEVLITNYVNNQTSLF